MVSGLGLGYWIAESYLDCNFPSNHAFPSGAIRPGQQGGLQVKTQHSAGHLLRNGILVGFALNVGAELRVP